MTLPLGIIACLVIFMIAAGFLGYLIGHGEGYQHGMRQLVALRDACGMKLHKMRAECTREKGVPKP